MRGLNKRRLVVGAATVVVMLAGPAPAARTPRVELQGALTRERIVGFGTVTPARDGRRARLVLLRAIDGGWEKIAAKRVRLRGSRDSNGDGRRDSVFSGSFPSPEPGTCKLRLRVPRTARFAPVRAFYEMPCARPDFATGTATLINPSSQTQIDVEIADTNETRQFGLMFKRRLGAQRGMVFRFDGAQTGGFWMKNTLIPLSIAFYSSDGTIVRILDMVPCGQEASAHNECPVYDPQTTYHGALEVNQGAFEEWDISEGDRIAVVEDP